MTNSKLIIALEESIKTRKKLSNVLRKKQLIRENKISEKLTEQELDFVQENRQILWATNLDYKVVDSWIKSTENIIKTLS